MDFFGMIGDAFSSIFDAIGDAILTAISNFIGMILYYITIALTGIVWLFEQFFNVFSGVQKITFKGEPDFLTNIFFNNSSVSGVYWAIAMIAVVFLFLFTIIAVVRKMFDHEDKSKKSIGGIIGAALKSMLIMLIMTAALNAVLQLANLGIAEINNVFDKADSFSRETEMEYTDEQFATMARIYNTIGNYSLNPSYNSRYNINSCYNDIRADLNYLENQGVFDMVYVTKENGVNIDTWQSMLKELSTVNDSRRELKMDVYYGEVSDTLLKIMDTLKTNTSFFALEEYAEEYSGVSGTSLDKIMFLSGTTSAARNDAYNENPSLTDGLRGAFYVGEKSIYSYDEVKEVFNTAVGGISYIFIWIMAFITIRSLFKCTLLAVNRVIGIITLYIVSPLTLATMPLDDGGKFSQWMTSMTINMLGILGTVIPMRVALMFAPIIINADLVLFPDSVVMNFLAKAVFILGSIVAVEHLATQINGILTNTAGMAAMGAAEKTSAFGSKAFKQTAMAAGVVAKKASDYSGLTTAANKIGEATGLSNLGERARDNGGLIGMMFSGGKTNAERAEAAKQQREYARDSAQNSILSRIEKNTAGGANQSAGPSGSPATPTPSAGGSIDNLSSMGDGGTTGGDDGGTIEPPPL